MADYITVDNLENIVVQNKSIRESVKSELTSLINKYNAGKEIKSEEKFAFNLLKKHGLIQIPIENRHWGGAIYFVDEKKIPVINTALPRVNQYFVAWHEVYHLIYGRNNTRKIYEVSTELKLTERKADYFAAKALMGNVYEYYKELKQADFIDRIALCMDLYRAPYKAILIELYEEAKEKNDKELLDLIVRFFDWKEGNWSERFRKLGLDEELVEASNVINFGYLEEKIDERACREREITVHETNRKYLEYLKERVKNICTKE